MNMVSSYPRNEPPPAEVTVKVASSLEELMQVFAIRAAVFMADQECPYHEEFDGNDFSASHIVAYCDGEPAATIRLRYFSEFAKIERRCHALVAVLRRHFAGVKEDQVAQARHATRKHDCGFFKVHDGIALVTYALASGWQGLRT